MAEKFHRLLYGHVQHIINRFTFVFYFKRLSVVPFSFADLARHVDIRQEVHFDLENTVT